MRSNTQLLMSPGGAATPLSSAGDLKSSRFKSQKSNELSDEQLDTTNESNNSIGTSGHKVFNFK